MISVFWSGVDNQGRKNKCCAKTLTQILTAKPFVLRVANPINVLQQVSEWKMCCLCQPPIPP
jgi:adenosine/AMP kinase